LASCNLVGPGLWCDSSDAQLGDEVEVEVVLAAGVDADMSRERRRECESARTSGAWPVRTDPSFTRWRRACHSRPYYGIHEHSGISASARTHSAAMVVRSLIPSRETQRSSQAMRTTTRLSVVDHSLIVTPYLSVDSQRTYLSNYLSSGCGWCARM